LLQSDSLKLPNAIDYLRLLPPLLAVRQLGGEFFRSLSELLGVISCEHHHKFQLFRCALISDEVSQPRYNFNGEVLVGQNFEGILQGDVRPAPILLSDPIDLLLQAAKAAAEVCNLRWRLRRHHAAQFVEVGSRLCLLTCHLSVEVAEHKTASINNIDEVVDQ